MRPLGDRQSAVCLPAAPGRCDEALGAGRSRLRSRTAIPKGTGNASVDRRCDAVHPSIALFGSDRRRIGELDDVQHDPIQLEILGRVDLRDTHGAELPGVVVGNDAADEQRDV